jgi:hypothetical protein
LCGAVSLRWVQPLQLPAPAQPTRQHLWRKQSGVLLQRSPTSRSASANSPSRSEFAACGNTVTSWNVGLKDLLPGFGVAECSGVARIAIPEQSVSPALKAPNWRDAFASKSPPFHDFVLVIAGVTFRRAHSAEQSQAGIFGIEPQRIALS